MKTLGGSETVGKHALVTEIAHNYELDLFSLGNRRYLGGKSKLLGFIRDEIRSALDADPDSLFDVFAGTGVVGSEFFESGTRIVANDILRHNYLALQCFLGSEHLDMKILAEKIVHLNNLKASSNYFSKNFGGTYFSLKNAKAIGAIREEIERISSSERERSSLITSLVYAADKVSNTVGHYDAFHRGQNIVTPLILKMPLIMDLNVHKNEIHCGDAAQIASQVKTQVAYLDPPYNSRQYSDAYHLLENLATWEKPEVLGVAKKMDRTGLKSSFCGKDAPKAFEELVMNLNAELICVSYNNTKASMNSRSNASISDEVLLQVLSSRGNTRISETSFSAFTTGRTKDRQHSERLFICEVRQ